MRDHFAEYEARRKGGRANGQDSWSESTNPDERRFVPFRFKDVQLSTSPIALIKGLIPREGLIVVWGPPKCGKSF